MVRDTSKAAFIELINSDVLNNQERQIMKWLSKRKRPVSRNQIERGTGIRINAVTGRCNRLVKDGYIEELPTGPCPITGNTVHFLRVASFNR